MLKIQPRSSNYADFVVFFVSFETKLYKTKIKVNYGEGLTEEQWLNAVDNGEDVRAMEDSAKSRA